MNQEYRVLWENVPHIYFIRARAQFFKRCGKTQRGASAAHNTRRAARTDKLISLHVRMKHVAGKSQMPSARIYVYTYTRASMKERMRWRYPFTHNGHPGRGYVKNNNRQSFLCRSKVNVRRTFATRFNSSAETLREFPRCLTPLTEHALNIDSRRLWLKNNHKAKNVIARIRIPVPTPELFWNTIFPSANPATLFPRHARTFHWGNENTLVRVRNAWVSRQLLCHLYEN